MAPTARSLYGFVIMPLRERLRLAAMAARPDALDIQKILRIAALLLYGATGGINFN